MVKVIQTCDTKVYALTEGSSLREWISQTQNQRSGHKKGHHNRVDIIVDFEFKTQSYKVYPTKDGKYIGGIGGFPSSFKVWDVINLTVKFERGLDFTPVDFIFLEDSWEKVAIIGEGRQLELHNAKSVFYKTRTPKSSRCLAYDAETATLFIGGSSNEIWRLNLEAGQWLPPLVSSNISAISCLVVSPVVPILFAAGEGEVVEAWNIRATYDEDGNEEHPSAPLAILNAWRESDDASNGIEITSCCISSNGIELVLGYSNGIVRVFNVTSKEKYDLEYDLRNGLAVKTVNMIERSHDADMDRMHHSLNHRDSIIATDEKSMKIIRKSDNKNGKLLACIDSDPVINHSSLFPNSGMILAATDNARIDMYYTPVLGSAPSFADNLFSLAAEAEKEEFHSFFEDYKFVTRRLLQDVGAAHLIGTDFVRPHMHGFFIEYKIYNEYHKTSKPAILKANMDEINEQKKKKALTAMRPQYKESKKRFLERVTGTKNDLTKELSDSKRQMKIEGLKKLLSDDRFSAMMKDDRFE